MSVNSTVAAKVIVGDELIVAIQSGTFIAVVCRHLTTGEPVGSIAGVPRLDELIRCIQQGVDYSARVLGATSTKVDVRVRRVVT